MVPPTGTAGLEVSLPKPLFDGSRRHRFHRRNQLRVRLGVAALRGGKGRRKCRDITPILLIQPLLPTQLVLRNGHCRRRVAALAPALAIAPAQLILTRVEQTLELEQQYHGRWWQPCGHRWQYLDRAAHVHAGSCHAHVHASSMP